jgi:hypothetical protein
MQKGGGGGEKIIIKIIWRRDYLLQGFCGLSFVDVK